MSDENKAKELGYDLLVVSGARFAMASRLGFSANAKGFLINGITAISIFISAGLLIADPTSLSIDAIAISLIGISIFTMWMNLDRSENDLRNRARLSRACAVEINEIRKKLEHGQISKDEALTCYEKTLLSFDDNHTTPDRNYAIFLIKEKSKKPETITWLNSALPWIALSLWYPFVFVAWVIFVYLISTHII